MKICTSWGNIDPIPFFCYFFVLQGEKELIFMHVRLMKVVYFLINITSFDKALLSQTEIPFLSLEEKKAIHKDEQSSGRELVI